MAETHKPGDSVVKEIKFIEFMMPIVCANCGSNAGFKPGRWTEEEYERYLLKYGAEPYTRTQSCQHCPVKSK